MDNYRPMQGQDYGILRKKEGREEELFVFGYSCKIYEDYDKSLYVDQGKHLIPWLGDESLKIDRYDCRGALNDLTKYLPKSESFDRYAILSNEEKRIEQLCDQERYRALTTNEEDEFLYQEEELKRLQQALSNEKSYSEVGFSYDNDKPAAETPSKEGNTEEEDEAFIPPYQLDVPVGMKIPKSKKHHEIIERTAFFIHDQGPQMEILLKIKQAENPQFNFLSFDNELHPYYRHLLMAVKNQRYKPTATPAPEEEEPKESSNEDTYLHPSLIPSSQPPALQGSASKIPTITYKPSTDCSYSALVNRIKGTQTASLLEGFKKKYGLDNPNPTNNNITTKNDTTTVSTSSLPLSALTKSARRRRIRKEKHKAAAASFKIYYAEEEVKNQDEYDDDEEETPEPEPSNKVKSNAENNEVSGVSLKPVPAPAPVVQLPPTDMQLIIDKMASYVAKNGRDFENVVRTKGDPRFLFLDKSHVYNPYYNQKVELYLQLENPRIVSAPPEKVVSERPASVIQKVPPPEHRTVKKSVTKSIKSSKSKQPIPICFSIKKPKDQEALEIKSALPYEESEPEEDEESEETGEKTEELLEDNFEKVPPPVPPEIMIPPPPPPETPPKQDTKKPSEMTLEKWAQDRLRAKLVTAAKEKLAAKAAKEKDKQLQAERRKKAAEFINLLQKDNLVNKIQTETTGNSTSNGKKDSDVITIESDSSVSDSDSVVSVPLSEEEEKQKQLKRKSEESNRDIYEKTKRRFTSFIEEKNKYKTKHRDHATNRNYSPPYSKHSHSKYRKYDKEKRSHSKKKKHRHSKDDISSSSSSKKGHKDHHKSKRSRYPSDDSQLSDSSTSSSGGTDSKK